MITTEPAKIVEALKAGILPIDSPAVPTGVFMVEPVNFRLNQDSSKDNQYMDMSVEVDPDRALEQYIDLVQLIRHAGVT
ncbi:MAG TPA: amidinotransferase, partial [Xanthomonadales bacterium]|nr:amidinotransferase [Xanthomonadales bacterium]